MRVAPPVQLTSTVRETLRRWSRGRTTAARLVMRSSIVLRAAEGQRDQDIAAALGTNRHTVALWRRRFREQGVPGIEKDAPRGGRKPTLRSRVERRIVEKTTQQKPRNATHWSERTLARELRVSRSMVHRVWKAHGLKPHRIKTFKVSRDPHFFEKLHDVVGLYLDPPEHALVLSLDEKSQIQALDRTQPSLPLYPGRLGTMTHDYKRNGTTTLFAAIDMLEGRVIATCMPRHRHREWIRFLELIDRQTPPELDLHLIADNYSTHKHPRVKAWLKRHPRFHMHFIPTSTSWLNVIERFFRDLTQKRLRRGAFGSVRELIAAIMAYIEEHNDEPKPFVWTAPVEAIIAKVGRARAALDKVTSG